VAVVCSVRNFPMRFFISTGWDTATDAQLNFGTVQFCSQFLARPHVTVLTDTPIILQESSYVWLRFTTDQVIKTVSASGWIPLSLVITLISSFVGVTVEIQYVLTRSTQSIQNLLHHGELSVRKFQFEDFSSLKSIPA
jgi:hypothetical protein